MGERAPNAAYRWSYRIAGMLCFERILLRECAPRPDGAVLYVGLHRNGALDGIPYLRAAPDAVFVLSAQLQRSALARLVFPGIAVSRPKDRVRGIAADNDVALERAVAHLAGGGRVFILPEGTSTLGPRHLPFKPGAARIAAAALDRGTALSIVPLAVHYECAWEWQSRVEVVVGAPARLAPGRYEEAGLAARITSLLETVGVNVETEARLREIEALAHAASLGSDLSYAACLKRLEAGVPAELADEARRLRAEAVAQGAWLHQGVPLLPKGSALCYAALWIALAPLMAAFLALNMPPLLAGRIAGRRLADALNVVAFWRAMAGLPCALSWSGGLALVMLATGHPGALAAYAATSLAGLRLWHRFRMLGIAVHNAWRVPGLRMPLLALHARLSTRLAA